MSDPFDALALPPEPVAPRPAFAAELRALVQAALDAPLLDVAARDVAARDVFTLTRPERSSTMPPSTLTPYLAVHDGAAAIAFYVAALDATEVMRIVGDDDRVGHAELAIGGVRLYLSDEYPELGVASPRTLGGTSLTLHLEVDDVDAAFARAVDSGASALAEPADQPHGARHGTLLDPFGHRWMLSQQIETLDHETLGKRMAEAGFATTVDAADTSGAPAAGGGIWAAINAADAPAMIRFMVEVLGFAEQLVVPAAEPEVIEHSQLVWPEGGVVQVGSAGRAGNPFSQRPTGTGSLYVITADPATVHRRCVDAGIEVLSEPAAPDYDPGGLVFSIRDHEGNLWSFGTYAG